MSYDAVMNWGREKFGNDFEKAWWNGSWLRGKKIVDGNNVYWEYFNKTKGYIDFDTRNYNHTLPLFMEEEPNEDDSNRKGGKRTRRPKRSKKTRKR